MTDWRKPSTAPRDGTIIQGLFERPEKRAIAFPCAFDVEDYRRLLADPAPDNMPEWIKGAETERLICYRTDASYGFRPLSDSEQAIGVGKMIGWRPLPCRRALEQDGGAE